jgi:hypothetical protein
MRSQLTQHSSQHKLHILMYGQVLPVKCVHITILFLPIINDCFEIEGYIIHFTKGHSVLEELKKECLVSITKLGV